MRARKPVILCFSGHDPSGGAGFQADLEVLTSHKCHALNVVTSLTAQDTRNVKAIYPQSPADFKFQAETILADIAIDAVKIGLIGSSELVMAIAQVLRQLPAIPVILDPVLSAGGGTSLANQALQDAMIEYLLPQTTVLTPNGPEARTLSAEKNLQNAAKKLLTWGCEHVFLTGGHEADDQLVNYWYTAEQQAQEFSWQRLTGQFHGSGCTLSSSIAALLAHGLGMAEALNEAQEYTWNALANAYPTGSGQLNPNRFYWMDHDE